MPDSARVWGNHRPGCDCKPCLANDKAEQERQAAAEARRREVEAAVAPLRAEVASLARQVARVCRVSGVDPARDAGSAPVQSQAAHQSRTGAMWQGSPDHDPRVVQAIVRGASDAEISAVRQQVMAEYRQAAAERQGPGQRSVMWRTRGGELVMDGAPAQVGASFGPSGDLVQQSVIDNQVPELGSEEG